MHQFRYWDVDAPSEDGSAPAAAESRSKERGDRPTCLAASGSIYGHYGVYLPLRSARFHGAREDGLAQVGICSHQESAIARD
jgi:hypothetical protein